MDDIVDILELKFDGGGINPSSVKPHEIAELIISFEKALLSTIKELTPEIDTEHLLFSFEKIDDKSLDLLFKPIPKLRTVVVASYSLISSSISSGDLSRLNNQTIDNLKAFPKFSKKYNCVGHLNLNNETLSTFTGSTQFLNNRNPTVKGQTTIYGKIKDAGGDNPNVHININDEYDLIFKVSEARAKELAHKLYENVALTGIAKWDTETFKIIGFTLTDILEYSPGSSFQAIQQYRKVTSGFWDNLNSNDEINDQLLRD